MTQNMERQFWKYVLPAMTTTLLASFYTMVDGFFVGRAIGDAGLAAINLAWPITAVIIATGMGIGTGGAVTMSIRRGAGDEKGAQRAAACTVLLLFLFTVAVTGFFLLTYPWLLRLLGAQGELHTLAGQYIRIIILGSGLQIFGSGLTPMLRNNGRSTQAMLIMVAGLIANIILDAWFIMGLQLSIAGAALATIIAQGVTAALSTLEMVCRKANRFPAALIFRPEGRTAGRILLNGLSPFGLSLSPSLVVVINNFQALRYGGESGVAAYSVISYIVGAAHPLLSGVGEGIQPLISYSSGAKDYSSMRRLKRKASITVFSFSGALIVLVLCFRNLLPGFFGTSAATAKLITTGLPIICAALPLIGFVRLASSYFYAIGDARFSLVLSYIDPLLFSPILLFVLPVFWDMTGIWLALPAAQAALALVVAVFYRKHAAEISIQEMGGGV